MKKLITLFFILLTLSSNINAKSFEEIEKEALNGSAEANFKIGLVYEYGVGFEKNQKKALEYYIKAHKGGIYKATTKLGIYFYERGNESSAINYFKEAAQNGENLSIAYIGKLYEDKKDFKKAFFYYKNASDKGVSFAKIKLARLYKEGLGTKKDISKSRQLYNEILKNKNNPFYKEALNNYNILNK